MKPKMRPGRGIIISISVLFLIAASILLTAGSGKEAGQKERNEGTPPPFLEVVRKNSLVRLAPTRKAKRRGVVVKGARLPVLGSADGPGCKSPWYQVHSDAWICGDLVRPSNSPPQGWRYPLVPDEELTPWSYGFVKEPAIEYRQEKKVLVPVREVLRGFGFGVKGIEKIGGKRFFRTAENNLVPREAVGIAGRISKFRGFEPLFKESVRIGWVNSVSAWAYDRPVRAGQYRIDKVERYTRFRVIEEAGSGAKRFYKFERNAWLSAADVRVFDRVPTPEGLEHGERWLDIDTKQQILAAYEGDRPVYITLV